MPRAAALTALMAALAAGAAGCTSSDETKSSGAGQETAAEQEAQSGPETTASSSATGVRLVRSGRFASPTYVTSPPGDRRRLYVTERDGRIRVLRDGRKAGRPLLDIASRVQTSGESGLLSMAFAPDFARSRRYYVYYVDNGGTINVDQYRTVAGNPERTQPGSRRTVIRQRHRRFNHKGGQLQFGKDGRLYMGFGDGGASNDPDENAQNLGRRLGKLLRIEPKANGGYRVPRDNPFVKRRGAKPEIFAYGLRNPYRFSFDRVTGDLAIGDVGQDAVEEIDFVRASRRAKRPRGGVNFGWDTFEGRRRNESGSAPGHVPPVIQRTHDQGFVSITGGYVIRDRSLGSLYGQYVYGDLADPHLRVARLRSARASGDRRLGPRVGSLVSFGEDARGRVYAVSLEGPVYRLARR